MDSITNLNFWTLAQLLGIFLLGMFIGMRIGKNKALNQFVAMQQQAEATRMWADSLKGYMEGRHGNHEK
jgi:hypothetical protein